MIDNYMALGARLTEEVEILEKVVIQRPRRNFIELALSLKKRIREYKRNLDPLNEAVKRMQHDWRIRFTYPAAMGLRRFFMSVSLSVDR